VVRGNQLASFHLLLYALAWLAGTSAELAYLRGQITAIFEAFSFVFLVSFTPIRAPLAARQLCGPVGPGGILLGDSGRAPACYRASPSHSPELGVDSADAVVTIRDH
jgi:hypothetical protein